MLPVYFVTLTIDNGCRFEKWRIAIPEENGELAIKKAEEIYYEDYAGYEDIIAVSEAQLISMTGYTIIK